MIWIIVWFDRVWAPVNINALGVMVSTATGRLKGYKASICSVQSLYSFTLIPIPPTYRFIPSETRKISYNELFRQGAMGWKCCRKHLNPDGCEQWPILQRYMLDWIEICTFLGCGATGVAMHACPQLSMIWWWQTAELDWDSSKNICVSATRTIICCWMCQESSDSAWFTQRQPSIKEASSQRKSLLF
jgi:hypothetical protein